MASAYYIAIDIGAGNGTRIALFQDDLSFKKARNLSRSAYGETFEDYASAVERFITELLREYEISNRKVRGIGIASAGILGSDGRFILTNNIPQLVGRNIVTVLRDHFHVPVAIENDANAGALAEWSVLKVELLYWAFGGGWGGAWISADGSVRYPALDWTGDDSLLDYSNEPGYAIPLEKSRLRSLFQEYNCSWERYENLLIDSLKLGNKALTGPTGSLATIRAEHILSGPGRFRLFHSINDDKSSHQETLKLEEQKELNDSTVAGKHISTLSASGYEPAVKTDALWGAILGYGGAILLTDATQKGLSEKAPICLGGKPSLAIPWFGPAAQKKLSEAGFMNYMRPSIIDERGMSANLLGAAVVAWKASCSEA